MDHYWSWLPDRAVIGVQGEEATSFLQGLVTQDMQLVAETPCYAMLLTPQGRYLQDFQIVKDGERYLLDIERERSDELLSVFRRYKLRARAELLDLRDEYRLAAAWGEKTGRDALPDGAIAWPDARLSALGWRAICPLAMQPDFAGSEASPEAYRHHRMALGVPEGSLDFTPEHSLPMQMGLEQLGGVSFTKGCYVGQELTARSKHRGELRKGLYLLQGSSLHGGLPVMAGEREAGHIQSVSGQVGLALLRHEAVQSGEALTVAGEPVNAAPPRWLAEPGSMG